MRLGDIGDAREAGAAPGGLLVHVAPVAVFDRHGERAGSVRNIVLDRRTGSARLAILSLGGLLPIGERLYPVPWDLLRYDERNRGYLLLLDRSLFQRAPGFTPGEEPTFDGAYESLVRRHYRSGPFPGEEARRATAGR